MPQVDDIGTVIDYDASESIEDGTVFKLKYKRPDGTSGEWIATLVGTQKARHITEQGDLPVAGSYDIQLYLETPSWKGHGTIESFEVEKNL